MTIDLSFIKALDRLQLILKRKIHADLQGAHETKSFGQGLVFNDYKMYVPGDDFRHIDWNVFARTDKFFIRRFEEERNLTVHILVDSSASMDYGRKMTKFDYAAMMGLGFAYIALRNNEKFTFATFTDEVQSLRPKKGADQLLTIMDKVSDVKVTGHSDFKAAMDSYKRVISHRSLIVLISDFLYDLNEVQDILFRYRHSEVYVVQVLDPTERELAIQGDVLLEDSETKKKLRTFISRRLTSQYQQRLGEHIERLKDLCEETDAAFVSVTSDTPIFETFYHILR